MKVIVRTESSVVKNCPLIRVFEAKEVSLDIERKELIVIYDRYVRYVYSYAGHDDDEVLSLLYEPVLVCLDFHFLYSTGYEG